MSGSAKSMGALALAVGAAVLLTGCTSTSGGDRPAPGSTTAVATSDPASPGPAATKTATAGTSATAAPAPEPTAVKTPAKPAVTVWDPCDIPNNTISRLGLNAASKQDLPGVGADGQLCSWQSPGETFELIVSASTRTFDDLRRSGEFTEFTEVATGGRPTLQYRSVRDTRKQGCYLVTDLRQPLSREQYGIAEFLVRNKKTSPDAGEPCAAARRFYDALIAYVH